MPKHVGVVLERINNKKIYYFTEHLLVFLHTILQDAQSNHQDVHKSICVILLIIKYC
jgi:hypothetical protein